VNAFRQVFGNNLAATRTHLRRATRINCDAQPTGPFRLVGRVLSELTPRSIANALVHTAPVAVLHVPNIQVLKGDNLELVHQSPAQFVCEVFAAVGNALVDMLDDTLMLAVFWCVPRALTQSALGFGKRPLILAEEARVGDVFTVAQSSKMRQANIHADGFRRGRERAGFNLTREAGIPIAQGIAFDGQCLDYAPDGSMELDLDMPDLGKTQMFMARKSPVALLLRVGERIIAILSTKSRIPRFLSRIHAAEECLKSKIEARHCFLHGLSVALLQPFMFCLPSREHLYGIVSGY